MAHQHTGTLAYRHIKEYFLDFAGLLFPRTCYACGKPLSDQEEALCIFCEFELPKTGFHLEADNQVAQRFWGRIAIQNATALYYFEKGGKVQNLVHQLKFMGKKDAGLFLGRKLGKDLAASALYSDIDLVVPVPLHKKRLRERGYNQCDLLARGIAEVMNVEWSPKVLARNHFSSSQTKKGRIARWENVKELFSINDASILQGERHILLVDDVVTTGATLEACATVLLNAPGVKVSIATIAVAK